MLIFESSAMQEVLAKARRFARSSGTVLITGETGTGKELLAQHLHEHSLRSEKPCVRVNCAAFHDGLAESELFGHEQGAFTGASRRHDGFLHAAADGLHARIIAATNRDLKKEVAAGRFREDLYHRLDVLTLRIAPLRERPQDIPGLVHHFVAQFGRENETPVENVSSEVLRQLFSCPWPGNVRQLRNVIHRACIESDTATITHVDIAASGAFDHPTESGHVIPMEFQTLPLEEIERVIILSRIERFRGNKTEAAAELGVTARTLRNKMARWREMKKAG